MPVFTRAVKALGGYLSDIFDTASFRFNNPHSFTKFLLIKKMQEMLNAKCLIETGTYRGVMAERCSRVFSAVYTIELDESLAERARRSLEGCQNVEVLCGDAKELLEPLLARDELGSAVVFLDAHYSGTDTACGDLPEPALEELRIISRHIDKVSAVVIDDFRSFGVEKGFPRKSELLRAVEEFLLPAGFRVHLFLDLLVVWRPGDGLAGAIDGGRSG